jgi:ribose transport system permease protein
LSAEDAEIVKPAAITRERLLRAVFEIPWLPVFAALVAMLVVFTIANRNFLTIPNLLNIGADMSETGVMAVGATLVLIAGGIDLSVGGVLAVSAITGALAMRQGGPLAVPLGVVTTLIVATLIGAANGALTVFAKLPPFVVTLATLGISVGIGYQLSNGTGLSGIPAAMSDNFGFARFGGVPLPIILWLLLSFAAIAILTFTRFGIRTYAIGSNVSAAERSGVDVKPHLVAVYAVSGLLAGVAGIIDIGRFSSAAVASHQTDVLAVVSATVIGGTSLFGGVGRIGGTLVGVAIIGILTNGLIMMGIQPYMQQVATGCFLLAALLAHRFREARRSARPRN